MRSMDYSLIFKKIPFRWVGLLLSLGYVGILSWATLSVVHKKSNHELIHGFNIETEKTTRLPSQVLSVYRGDLQRQGAWTLTSPIKDIKVSWEVNNLFADIHGASKSTPAVDSTGIYFGTDLGVFYRFSHEGQKIWSFKSEAGSLGIHGTALLDEHYVYFGNYSGLFYCLDKNDGHLVWSTDVGDAVGSSPLILEDKIIFSAEFSRPKNGYLVALSRESGQVVWTSNYFEEQVHSSPTYSPENGVLGVGSNANTFWGIDPANGEILWAFNTQGPIKDTAALYKNQFCFTSWDKHFYCVDSQGQETGSVAIDGASQSSPAIDAKRGFAYFTSNMGTLYKVNLSSFEVEQQTNLSSKELPNKLSQPSPILLHYKDQATVVTSCFADSLCLVRADNLKLIKRLPVGGLISGSIAIFNRQLYVNINSKGLTKIDLL